MKKKVVAAIIVAAIGTIVYVSHSQSWIVRLVTPLASILTIVGVFLDFHRLLAKLWNLGRQEMEVIRIRYQQSKNPTQFITLNIDKVDFNPKAYLKKEQDYLELNLSITSSLLKDFPLCRLLGSMSIEGSHPPETFEIYDNLVIKKTGQINVWNNVVVKLSKETQQLLHMMRSQEQDAGVSVVLSGYRDGKLVLNLTKMTGKIKVPRLPT